jgi:hypothetical protein
MTVEWHGGGSRTAYKAEFVDAVNRLAHAAKAGDWDGALAQLDAHPDLINTGRIGGPSGFRSLHQAAWHGASTDIVDELVRRGAWRTLRASSGLRPEDIARERGHGHLAGSLRPVIVHEVGDLDSLQERLHEVILGRVADLVEEHRMRLPVVEPLTEMEDPELWFPVPGFYGGFKIQLRDEELWVDSWCRVVGGSGQRHRITADGVTLVESGFV